MSVAAIIDWYGPYPSVEAFKQEMRQWSSGTKTVYMALGLRNKIRYIGMTERPATRFNDHRKLHDPGNTKFFAGEIMSYGVPGKRKSKQATDLVTVEAAFISYFEPELNNKLKAVYPADCVSIFSRFFDPNDWERGTTPLNEKKFPSLLGYNSWTEEFVTS